MKLLVESTHFYGQGKINLHLPGVDRNFFLSELLIQSQIYNFFKPLTSYFTVILLKTMIGFLSMVLLLRSTLFNIPKNISYGIAFCFALLPGLPIAYFSQASLPLAIFLLYKSTDTSSRQESLLVYAGLLIYPTLSHLFYYGVFLLAIASLYLPIIYYADKLKALRFLSGLITLAVGYIIIEYRMFYQVLIESAPSLRDEFSIPSRPFLKRS